MATRELATKVAIVTGGSQGVGRRVVEALLGKKLRVASLDISQSSASAQDNLLPIQCNMSDKGQVQDAVNQVIGKWGRIDVLVNNAGITDDNKSVSDTSFGVWDRVLGVNLHGPMFLMHFAIPHMLKNNDAEKGSIVNVCSIAAARGAVAGAAYTTSKHGLLGLTRSTAWMYRHAGIRCNAVLPGAINTGIVQNSGNLIDPNNTGELAPFMACCPGMLEPEQVANAIVFLATAEGVNGAEVAVDKGWLGA